MNKHFEHDLLDMYANILENGEDRQDRTGTGTRALFAERIVIDLSLGFPAVTTKKLAWKSMASELLWFLEGSGDERRLAEIMHGTRDSEKKTIWTANAEADYWKPKAKFTGDLGRVYGMQWRKWQSSQILNVNETIEHGRGASTLVNAKVKLQEIDQFKHLINALKNNPTDRRMIITAWNPGELDQQALPPCHMLAQFYRSNDNKLSCQMYQRSCDTFLGLPFNIASYALLTSMIAQVVNAEVGTLTMILGDTHIYQDHIDQVNEQLTRAPYKLPKLWLNPNVTDIDSFTMDDMRLEDYEHHAPIIANMAV